MADCFLGEIRLFAGTYAPVDWALCDGILMQIRQNEPLYSLIGTTYGGDGVNTFALPDFRGRVPVGQGQTTPPPGSTSSLFALGQAGGTEVVALTAAQNPAHSHNFCAVNRPATTSSPVNNMVAAPPTNGTTQGLYISAAKTGTTQVADPNFLDYAGGVASGGSSQVTGDFHQNMMPYLALTYIICTKGFYPTQP